MPLDIHVTYRVRSDAGAIAERAQAIAVEQSVEMPIGAIDDALVKTEILGRVFDVEDAGGGFFSVRIALAAATVGADAGQFMNMLFGNTSLHDDVWLEDAELPAELVRAFGGPRHGIAGFRRRTKALERALTCTALKPQGLSPQKLADLARRFAEGGIDTIKDDHGLADQTYAPFAGRLAAVCAALRDVGMTVYVPSLNGDLDAMRAQIAAARNEGLDTVMVTPMVAGLSNVQRLIRDNPDFAFLAHPALAGSRISPSLLFGKIFRMIGADALVYPNHGGRFGYSPATCQELAHTARAEWHGLKPALPVPAGGMTLDRVAEMLDFYGPDIMLLIGGGLLTARERLTQETRAFVEAVKTHRYQ